MNRQMANCKLLLMYLCFAEISTIASSNSMTIEGSVTIPIPTATVGLFSEMMASLIQPSSTFEAANEKLTPTTITTTYSTESQMSTTTPLMIATIVSIMLSPSTAPTPTTEIFNTAPSDPQTTTEMTTNTKDRPPGPQSTILLPINTEILALIAIGLSGMSCYCEAVFSLWCVLTLTGRGCKKSQQARKEFKIQYFVQQHSRDHSGMRYVIPFQLPLRTLHLKTSHLTWNLRIICPLSIEKTQNVNGCSF